jgi:hypothetical protein
MEKKEKRKEQKSPTQRSGLICFLFVGGLICFLFVGGLIRSLQSPPTALGGSLN